MKEQIKENVKKITERDGIQNQLDITVEETGEWLQALMKYGRKQREIYHSPEKVKEARTHLIDEMADMYFMLYTIEQVYNIDFNAIEERLAVKNERINKKLNGSYDENKKDN